MSIIYSKTFSILSHTPACGTMDQVLMHMTMVWTTLSSCGASHHSLSRYVTSLLASKSRSSRRVQIASLIARSSLFAYANNSFRSSVFWPISSGLWPSPTLMSWNPHPLRSTLIDVCLRKHQWHRSVLGFQLNSSCHINNQCQETYPRTSTAKTPHKITSRNSNENSNILKNGLVPPCYQSAPKMCDFQRSHKYAF